MNLTVYWIYYHIMLLYFCECEEHDGVSEVVSITDAIFCLPPTPVFCSSVAQQPASDDGAKPRGLLTTEL